MSTSSTNSVVQFYAGKSVFVTGATGFVGKVLVEKLLRSCPDVGQIYLLVRTGRKGETPAARLKELFQSKAFTFSKETLDFTKVTAIEGDMTKPELGISPEDRQVLADSVDVIIHSAATVRFHGPLKDFVVQNVLGTESIMKLAGEMKNLKSLVYVSTAYANCNLLDIEEKVYPLEKSAQVLIDEIMSQNSDKTPNVGDPELMGRPNSYTMSKAIAENLVREKYSHLPVVICRPSIVTHAFKEPTDGWCDSMNGLAGTLLLGGLGIARTMEINCDYNADIVPVDFVANSLIVIGWHTATYPEQRRQVVHITSGVKNPITWGQILDFARVAALKSPSMKLVRPIARNPVSAKGKLGKINHKIVKFFSHYVFAILFDIFLMVTGNKRIMWKVTQKMHKAFDVLEHFTNREWCFRYHNYSLIFAQLTEQEKVQFESNIGSIDWLKYCDSLQMGSRRYLMKEEDSTIEAGRRRQHILTITWNIVDTIIYLSLLGGAFFLGIWIHGRLVPKL